MVRRRKRSRQPKYKQIGPRTESTKTEADSLLRDGHYVASILHYSIYVEQLLITAHLFAVRSKDVDAALQERDELLRRKEKESFTFGKVIGYVVPGLIGHLEGQPKIDATDPQTLNELARSLKEVRNKVSAHPFYLVMLDPTNKWKRVFADVNYYRKVMRRLRKLIVGQGLEVPPYLDMLLERGHPLTLSSNLDREFECVEVDVLRLLAEKAKDTSEQIRTMLEPILPNRTVSDTVRAKEVDWSRWQT